MCVTCTDGLAMLPSGALHRLFSTGETASASDDATSARLQCLQAKALEGPSKAGFFEFSIALTCSLEDLRQFVALPPSARSVAGISRDLDAPSLLARHFLCDLHEQASKQLWTASFKALLHRVHSDSLLISDASLAAAWVVDSVGLAFAWGARWSTETIAALQGMLQEWSSCDVSSIFDLGRSGPLCKPEHAAPAGAEAAPAGAAAATATLQAPVAPPDTPELPWLLTEVLDGCADSSYAPLLLTCVVIERTFMGWPCVRSATNPLVPLLHWAWGVRAPQSEQKNAHAHGSDAVLPAHDLLARCAMAVRYAHLAGCAPWAGDPAENVVSQALGADSSPGMPPAKRAALKRALLQDLVKRATAHMRFASRVAAVQEDAYFGFSGMLHRQLSAAQESLGLQADGATGVPPCSRAAAAAEGGVKPPLHQPAGGSLFMLLPAGEAQTPAPRQWWGALQAAGLEPPPEEGDPPRGGAVYEGGGDAPFDPLQYTLQWHPICASRLRRLQQLATNESVSQVEHEQAKSGVPGASTLEQDVDMALRMWLPLACSLHQAEASELAPAGGTSDSSDALDTRAQSGLGAFAFGLVPIAVRMGSDFEWDEPLQLVRWAYVLACFGGAGGGEPPLAYTQLRARTAAHTGSCMEPPAWLVPAAAEGGKGGGGKAARPPVVEGVLAEWEKGTSAAQVQCRGRTYRVLCPCGCGSPVWLP